MFPKTATSSIENDALLRMAPPFAPASFPSRSTVVSVSELPAALKMPPPSRTASQFWIDALVTVSVPPLL
jgi:hypothetical protein